MKTIYLIKLFLPFLFLPLAPEVVQVELERHGIVSYGSSACFTVILQILFSLGMIAWLAYEINRKTSAKAFLKMSCVSKKVFHLGKWMSVENYLADQHNIIVSHGMTPEEYESWMQETLMFCDPSKTKTEIQAARAAGYETPARERALPLPALQAQTVE